MTLVSPAVAAGWVLVILLGLLTLLVVATFVAAVVGAALGIGAAFRDDLTDLGDDDE
jgi:uncharacterized membrane protein YjjB (DUF3815 family)